MANRYSKDKIDLVVFGSTGDLMARKILPSLFYLYKEKKLPKEIKIIGVSRRDITQEGFIEKMRQAAEKFPDIESDPKLNLFFKLFIFVKGFFGDEYTYEDLGRVLDKDAKRFFYLSVAPSFYPIVLKNIYSAGLINKKTHIIIEKPTGLDLKSAKALEKILEKYFKPDQIYRVDHYLAKDGIKKLYEFRLKDKAMQKVWNKDYISKIELRLWEKKDIQGRGEFYESVGALRDVGQNHLMSMLAYVAMASGPSGRTARREGIHEERAKVIELLKVVNIFRSQYRGYREEKGVKKNSKVETFFRINAVLKDGKFKNVPILIESGKSMPEDKKEIAIFFKDKEEIIFPVETKDKKYQYIDEYKKILIAAFEGDGSMFLGSREVLAAWKFCDPIVEAFKKNKVPLKFYDKNIYP